MHPQKLMLQICISFMQRLQKVLLCGDCSVGRPLPVQAVLLQVGKGVSRTHGPPSHTAALLSTELTPLRSRCSSEALALRSRPVHPAVPPPPPPPGRLGGPLLGSVRPCAAIESRLTAHPEAASLFRSCGSGPDSHNRVPREIFGPLCFLKWFKPRFRMFSCDVASVEILTWRQMWIFFKRFFLT